VLYTKIPLLQIDTICWNDIFPSALSEAFFVTVASAVSVAAY